MEQAAKEVILECRGIKGVRACGGWTVALEVRAERCAVWIGENGSGKSTVTSIFAGMQPRIRSIRKTVKPRSMEWAATQGVGMIVQETGTLPEITVAENMFLCQADRFASFRKKGRAALARSTGRPW